MSTLDEMKRNALPPSSADGQVTGGGPVEYKRPTRQPNPNIPVMSRREIDPTTLGAPPAPPKPTVLDKMMDQLDRAIERDKKEMMERVIAPAQEAYQNNVRFGTGGENNYFDSEIGEDITPAGTISEGISDDYKAKATAKPIEIPKETAQTLHTVSGQPYMPSQAKTVETDAEDDFLNDDSIYDESEETEMEEYSGSSIPYTGQQPKTTTEFVNTTTAQPSHTYRPETHYEPRVQGTIDPAIIERPAVESTPVAEPEVQKQQSYSDKFIDEAFADDDDSSTDLSDVNKEDLDSMKDMVRKNIKPVNNVIDLSSVRISTKPVSAGRVLSILDTSLPTAKWVLPVTGTSFIISALKGAEIDLLANRRQGQTDLMRNQEIVQTFYNHLATSDKPASWEAWAKSIVYDDFVHLYFGIYMACFSNANFAPFECESATCKHSFMDRIEMESMVKYKDEDAEARVKKLLNTTPKTGSIDMVLKQVSDNVVIGFRKPTVWNVMFEDLYLPEKVRTQMRDIVGVFRHIGEIYIYDYRTGELRPVETKPVAGDMTKTLKNRFKIYYDVLKSLTSDQLTAINVILSELHKDSDLITYQYPEFKCPKCGHVTPAREEEPINILFLRHQLQNILLS